MNDDHAITFKLNGKKPHDFTIERLAQYLRVLADLTGNADGVRIVKISAGSVRCALAVQSSAYPAFVDRITTAKNPDRAQLSVMKTVASLEDMISVDGVTAEISSGRTKLLFLRGYTKVSGEVIGPVIQHQSIRGRIVGLEGKDATKHVRIVEYSTNREIRGEFRDDSFADSLKKHLWKDVIEICGTARLLRHPTGEWELKSFRIERIQELDDAPASEVLRDLAKSLGPASGAGGLLNAAKKIRG